MAKISKNKVNQHDDTTLIMDGSKETFSEAMSTLDKFGDISGWMKLSIMNWPDKQSREQRFSCDKNWFSCILFEHGMLESARGNKKGHLGLTSDWSDEPAGDLTWRANGKWSLLFKKVLFVLLEILNLMSSKKSWQLMSMAVNCASYYAHASGCKWISRRRALCGEHAYRT